MEAGAPRNLVLQLEVVSRMFDPYAAPSPWASNERSLPAGSTNALSPQAAANVPSPRTTTNSLSPQAATNAPSPQAATNSDRRHRPVSAAAKGSRSALCIWLPTFELRLELVRTPELDGTSVALLAPGSGGRKSVWQVSGRAHDSGVRPGQLVSRAVALCPGITLLEPDPAHYEAAGAAITRALSRVTPIVEPGGIGRIFLGMDGLVRLLGAPSRQVGHALRALYEVLPARIVASVRVGMAPGKFGAWIAAASAGAGDSVIVPKDGLAAFLASKPVRALPLDERIVSRLERLGVTTLGGLRRFPAPALVSQFGADGAKALGWASGRRIDPVRPLFRPRPIRAVLDFPEPAGVEGTLHAAIDRLIEIAVSRPERHGRGVTELRVRAHLEGGGSWIAKAVLREPTAELSRMGSPLKARFALSPPPRAVESLVLELTGFGAPNAQTELFAPARGGRALARGEPPKALGDAARELRLRLGHPPLYRVVEVEPWSRVPERRHALLNFDPA